MKILILNRRDISNPSGGGAEKYTHEIARGLSMNYNCTVEVFACLFPGGSSEELLDGIRYIRRGNELTVHFHGFLYAAKNRAEYDVIIDEFNGVGFFTFMMSNSIVLIHQLYREFWLAELGFSGIIPFVVEPFLLKLYRKKPAVTVSASTKKDLELLGYKNVSIIMNAVDQHMDAIPKKDGAPTMIFLGRLKKTKRPEDSLTIFRKIREKIPGAKLWIVGRGPSEKKLRALAEGLDGVVFTGWAENSEKMSLLKRAHILVVPSIREGFGINVIEAASVGTPAVGYDVPGLRDSILQGKTGYVVQTSHEAADKILLLFENKDLYIRISMNCIDYSREFVWEKRVDEFWQMLKNIKPQNT